MNFIMSYISYFPSHGEAKAESINLHRRNHLHRSPEKQVVSLELDTEKRSEVAIEVGGTYRVVVIVVRHGDGCIVCLF
jgi:hypothetical protein